MAHEPYHDPARLIQDLFTSNFHFSHLERCLDVRGVDPAVTELSVDRDTKNISQLPELTGLRKLCVSSMKTDIVAEISQLPSLRILCVQFCNTGYEDLSLLAKLTNLKCLILQELRKPQSVQFLSSLESLVGLELNNIRQVRDLTPLGKLKNLVELKIETGGMLSGQLAMETLSPLSHLQNLEYLALYVLSADKSLEPLSHLKNLKTLHINGHYRWEEYAKLDARLPDTDCKWFKQKVMNWELECKKCGAHAMVGLPGKGKRMVCSECQPHKVDELVAGYDEQFQYSLNGNW